MRRIQWSSRNCLTVKVRAGDGEIRNYPGLGAPAQGINSKFEIRILKQCQKAKIQMTEMEAGCYRGQLVSDFDIRISQSSKGRLNGQNPKENLSDRIPVRHGLGL